ncbi:MAG: PDZ domain-containing protein [Kordiimonadaceae bacterium]|nr:PDZ domain-containing protein [Kordiimonadaceae bacterium]MBO6569209.1 PDZ domain-containing protein [Kordiimonadaceae bacterium]MBO6964685.1 PDZ domain-containing protein [Kordiimonadaceae bacterium]
MTRKLLSLALSAGLSTIALAGAANAETRLVKQADVSENHIAFVYGGDIWVADRDGANPRQLTTRQAPEMMPHFSPDGETIAFSATYDGNTDVYTIPVSGGAPTRLTWHPGADVVSGWTPDGDNILFMSRREMTSGRSAQAWHVSASGGFPTKIMDAVVMDGRWDSDGEKLAYQPYNTAHRGASGWRNHRGGSTPPIWVLDPASGDWEEVPHENGSDTNPIWVGDDVYFLSDRSGMKNLWKYDSGDKSVEMVTNQETWDINWARAHGNDILFTTTAGDMVMFDTRRGRTRAVDVTLNPDSPEARPHWKNAMPNMTFAGLSPTGKRAVVTARGDVYTVPLDDGSTRNLTRSAGAKESTALWSPKGGEIAYLSDATRKNRVVITDQSGAELRSFDLGDDDYQLVTWSADGGKIIIGDNHLAVWSMDTATGALTKIYTDNRRSGVNVSLSPDGNWLAYTKARANYFNDVFLYSFADGSHTQLTDGMSHAASPAFSPDGKHLFFAASTNAGPTAVGLDMSTQERPIRFGLYAAVLAADGKSPLLPKAGDEAVKSDEEPAKKENGNGEKSDKKSEKKDEKATKVDLDGLTDRIVALPVAERSYRSLQVAHDGGLFFLEFPQPGGTIEPNGRNGGNVAKLMRFDFKAKKASKAMDRVTGYSLSADGKMVIVATPERALMTAKAAKDIKAKKLNTSDVKAFINPREEWAQIFDEAWRLEHQYFYAANMHGLDWDGVYEKYRPLVDHVATRADLNRLIVDMISELEVGHNRAGGGDLYRDAPVATGMLGADLRIVDGKYQVARIYDGENWNPFVKAPLAAPGIGVTEGDFIHAVNGAPVDGASNIFAHFANTVGKQVTLTVSTDGTETREVVVEPIGNERQLRHWAWVEGNRKAVEAATDGRVGYVYLPNTAGGGFTYFNRMFFAQSDKKAMIIDERQNGGGQAANYITDVLSRQYLSSWLDRDGLTFETPGGAVFGPKVMLIDQDAGSGGDFLPYSFKRMGIGKLIGKRTWGGLIGISANPRLIDGGFLTVPFFRFYTPEGEWRVENEGVAPDIDVTLDPTQVNAGVDVQLNRAIQEVLSELETYEPIKRHTPPALPTELGG